MKKSIYSINSVSDAVFDAKKIAYSRAYIPKSARAKIEIKVTDKIATIISKAKSSR